MTLARAPLPFALPLAQADILRRRAEILARLCALDEGFCTVPVSGVRGDTLQTLLRLYDERFLGGFLRAKMPMLHVTLSFRLVSAAGKFLYAQRAPGQIAHAEIRLSGDFLMRLQDGPFSLNGLTVSTAQEAFLVVFEHEFCHALEVALCGQTGHSARFLSLANGLFGHTATRHSLPTRRQAAAQNGLLVGSRVRFAFEEKVLCGIVTYIGKRATVMVKSPRGAYHDPRGRRYDKYYVPLDALTRLS